MQTFEGIVPCLIDRLAITIDSDRQSTIERSFLDRSDRNRTTSIDGVHETNAYVKGTRGGLLLFLIMFIINAWHVYGNRYPPIRSARRDLQPS